MIIKKLLIIFTLLSFIFLNANESIQIVKNEIYTLPYESDEIKNEISDLIDNANNEIIIAMYNFSYKKFVKNLINASKRGVHITVILDYKKNLENKEIEKELKNNNINLVILKDKMHLKVALVDKKTAILGSSNWTKESFKENYEIIMVTNDNKVILKLKDFLEKLEKQ